ncbi:MAG: ribosome maturation factor RimM [Candidatus Methylomirabilia bacterium]
MIGDLVPIGEVLKPRGLRGEVKVRPLVEDRAQFERLGSCFLVGSDATRAEPRRVESVRSDGGAVVLKLERCESVEDAQPLVGRLVAVPAAQLSPLPPGQFYAHALVGSRVVTTGGVVVGTFLAVEPGPAQDLWVVRDEGREHLIPAVVEIVVKVDMATRTIVIRPPEGLLDL